MSFFFHDKNRRVLPRWRDSRLTAELGELGSLKREKAPIRIDKSFLDKAASDWRTSPSEVSAFEIVSAAIVAEHRKIAEDAAFFILSRGTENTAAKELARHYLNPKPELRSLNPTDSGKAAAKIANLRLSLRQYPRDALAWVDLALAHTTLGQKSSSTAAMRVGLGLAPNNRFVLRSAARLLTHLGEPDRAHDLLLRSPAVRHDPWLAAAEVSLADILGVPPEMGTARRLLTSAHMGNHQLSELASAVATAELYSGRNKAARKYFRQSLESPTENAVAQATWASNRPTSVVVPESALQAPRSYEALAWHYHRSHRWAEAAEQCELWLQDEAFSARPAELGSFIAATTLEDFSLCESFARAGLMANPHHAILNNNLAVALVNTGRTDEAQSALLSVRRPSQDAQSEATLTATEGLIAFRLGDCASGNAKYLESIRQARAQQNRRLECLATLHLAQERLNRNDVGAISALNEGERLAKGLAEPEVLSVIQRLRKRLEEGSIEEGRA